MEENNRQEKRQENLGRVSWFGYIKMIFSTVIQTVILSLVLIIVGGILMAIFLSEPYPFTEAEYKIFIFNFCKIMFVCLLVYNLAWVRSVVVYYDENGVWLYSGILPWNKGVNGVKWTEIDEALYFTGFFSWLFKSYTVTIRHKYTKTSEIVISNLYRGNIITARINRLIIENHPEKRSI